MRWSDDPDSPNADKTLVLIAYLGGLGYANHMMGFLAGPAVLAAVFTRRPAKIMQWKLVLACVGALLLGMSPFLTQPIRAAHFPPINEGEPTTWNAFWDNFNRVQYAKPPLLDRQAPFFGFDFKWNGFTMPPIAAHLYGQLGMYWFYFKWQWFRDPIPTAASAMWQSTLAGVFFILGIFGGWVHFKRDRRSWWYFATFMFTITLVLIFYLNFKFGNSQAPELGESIPREVRDRDYFFMVSFAAWGVWAALGLVWVWEGIAEIFGVEQVKIGRETMEIPVRQSWLLAMPVLAIAFVPLFLNYKAASRAHQTDTRDFAHDLLDSVEPYGVLITAGDNDTFPLWYAQEVEGHPQGCARALHVAVEHRLVHPADDPPPGVRLRCGEGAVALSRQDVDQAERFADQDDDGRGERAARVSGAARAADVHEGQHQGTVAAADPGAREHRDPSDHQG